MFDVDVFNSVILPVGVGGLQKYVGDAARGKSGPPSTLISLEPALTPRITIPNSPSGPDKVFWNTWSNILILRRADDEKNKSLCRWMHSESGHIHVTGVIIRSYGISITRGLTQVPRAGSIVLIRVI